MPRGRPTRADESRAASRRRPRSQPPIPRDERTVTDETFLGTLDPDLPGLTSIHRAMETGDLSTARIALVEHFRRRRAPRWFFDRRVGGRGPIQPPWAEGTGAAVLARADALLDNRFCLLGDLAWDFGSGLNWYNTEMRGLGSAPSQLKRCNWMRDLALAWRQTRRPEYAGKLAQLIDCWLADWPLVVDEDFGPDDAIFCRGDSHKAMPTAFRVISWLDVLYSGVLFAPQVPVNTTFSLLKSMWFTALQYRRYVGSQYRPANHHLWERGTAPFVFGTMLPEFPEVAVLADQGRPVVCRHAGGSFLADGTYEERSTSYTMAALRMFAIPERLARLNRAALLDRSGRAVLRRCGETLASLVLPDGSLPDIGDGRPSAGVAAMLGTMATVFGGRASGRVCRSLGLLSQVTGEDRTALRLPSRRPLPAVSHLPASGYFVARDNWRPDASAMSFSVPGPGIIYNHAHDDPLHLQILVRGVPIIGTPLTELYSYLNQDRMFGTRRRGHFFAMSSHNLVLVHGRPARSEESLAPRTSWGAVPIPVDLRRRRLPDGVRAVGSHTGYPGYHLARSVTFRHGKGWEIVDRVSVGEPEAGAPAQRAGTRTHLARWHFEYGVEVSAEDGEYVARRGGVGLRISVEGPGKVAPRLYRDENWLGRNPLRPGAPAPWMLDVRFGRGGDAELTTVMEIL
jgi:hypothetical protein